MRHTAALLLALILPPACAHEVHHVVAATNAVSISLSDGDRNPFAYEKYELFAEDAERPAQVGNTDVAGRIVFIPGDAKQWRIKTYSADGHGLDLRFEAPAAPTDTMVCPEVTPSPSTLALLGLGLILAGFGAYQLFRRKST